MTAWYATYDSVFFLSVGGIILGGIGLCIRTCYKCKLSDVDLCFGLIKVKRDTRMEEQLDEVVVHNQPRDEIPTPTMTPPIFSTPRHRE
jgi:hypothetical protein